jgi:CubicO group peptidase (beta-lactamase class C family)
MTTRLHLLAVAAAGWAVACGSNGRDSSLRETLETYRAEHQVVGVAAAAVTAERVLFTDAAGLADRERGRATSPESVFLVASVTKAVLAVATMALVEDGRLQLDADINTYLPITIVNPAYPSMAITARQLLAHVSSISDRHYLRNAAAFYTFDADPTMSLADFIAAFFAPGGAFVNADTFTSSAPATAYEYSNVGFALLGYVVERAAGEPLQDYVRRRVFAPLHMTGSSFRLADVPADARVMPYGPGSMPTGHYTFADYPDGGLRSTVEDLATLLRMVMAGGQVDGRRVLGEAGVAELLRVQFPQVPDAGDQALGWDIRDAGARRLLGHAGAETGVAAALYFDPLTDTGAIVLANRGLDDHLDAFTGLFLQVLDAADLEADKR